jgi:hypothetical protein
MAADTAPGLAGHVVHVGPFGLDGHVILVECLEENVGHGRHHEMGTAVLFDRHNTMLDFQAQVCLVRDYRMLLTMSVAFP